jgi:hypothetical protein
MHPSGCPCPCPLVRDAAAVRPGTPPAGLDQNVRSHPDIATRADRQGRGTAARLG